MYVTNINLLNHCYKSVLLFLSFFIVVQLQLSPFSPSTLPCLNYPPSSTLSLSPNPVVFVHGSCIHVPRLDLSSSPPFILFPHFLWSLSVCSLFPHLWQHFAYLFALFIRFHLSVRSFGICLSLPGLFNLALLIYSSLSFIFMSFSLLILFCVTVTCKIFSASELHLNIDFEYLYI